MIRDLARLVGSGAWWWVRILIALLIIPAIGFWLFGPWGYLVGLIPGAIYLYRVGE
jgi:hypothetical protein